MSKWSGVLGGDCQVGALKGRLKRAPSPQAYATMRPRDIDSTLPINFFRVDVLDPSTWLTQVFLHLPTPPPQLSY